MINFIKCLTEIQINDIGIGITIQIDHDFINYNMVKELGQAVSAFPEAVLVWANWTMCLEMVDNPLPEYSLKYFYEMGCHGVSGSYRIVFLATFLLLQICIWCNHQELATRVLAGVCPLLVVSKWRATECYYSFSLGNREYIDVYAFMN